jgi:virginiamycin A acetyltransferase
MRRAVRSFFYAIACLLDSPLLLLARTQYAINGRDEFFKSFGQLLSLFPGRFGSYMRVAFYRFTLSRATSAWSMQIFSKFTHPEGSIGRDVYIGMHCTIGRVHIADHVLIADYVQLMSGRHQHSRAEERFTGSDSGVLEVISVGRGSWIGGGAIVMADVGTGCVVGAGSVVTKPVPDGCTVAGNPARVIREAAVPAGGSA